MSRALHALLLTLDDRAWPEAAQDQALGDELRRLREAVERLADSGAPARREDLETLARLSRSEPAEATTTAWETLTASAGLALVLVNQAAPRRRRRR